MIESPVLKITCFTSSIQDDLGMPQVDFIRDLEDQVKTTQGADGCLPAPQVITLRADHAVVDFRHGIAYQAHIPTL